MSENADLLAALRTLQRSLDLCAKARADERVRILNLLTEWWPTIDEDCGDLDLAQLREAIASGKESLS